MDAEEEKQLRVRLAALKQEHRALDQEIDSLEANGNSDQIQFTRLKKKKLQIKDEISEIEDRLLPDIIA